MKKLIFFIGVFILLTFLGFVYFIFRDIPKVDDSDLLLSKVEIPEEENAYYPLKEAVSKIYIPPEKIKAIDEIVYKDTWDKEFIEELLEKNKEVFEIFKKATEYNYFQFPDLDTISYISLSNESKNFALRLSDLSKLVIIKSKYLIKEGKEKEALDLIFGLIKIGHMIEEGFIHDSIIYSFGAQTKKHGLKALIEEIPYLHLSREESNNYINKLENFKGNKDGLIRALKGDYMNFLKEKEVVEENLRNEFKKNNFIARFINFPDYIIFAYFSYKPNETKKLIADLYREVIDKANKDCYEIEIEKLFPENLIGKMIYDTKIANVYKLIEIKCLETLYIEAAKTLLELKAYKIENGNLPKSLEELVPEYLTSLPKDPFDGKALKYSPKEKIIYSIKGEKFFIDF
jgi:hypothetical protein